MKAQLTYLVIFLLFLLFLVALFIGHFFINKVLPANTMAYNTTTTIYTTTDTFFDNSFIIFFFALLIFDVVASYINPSTTQGIINVFLLLAVVYIVFFTQNFLPTLNNVLSANTILPTSYAFLNNVYLPYIVFMFLIASIVLNFRHKQIETEGEYE